MSKLSGHLKYTRDGPHGHKDKYWVADLSKGTLSCYKNDSDAVAQFVIMAHQIHSVREDIDRQNKFFDFRVKTSFAKDAEFSFRSQSKQDRDRWIQAINSLIANKKSSLLSKQFTQAVEGRCEDGAKKLALKHGRVTYDGPVPLAHVPTHLWPTYIKAVEEGLRVAESVIGHDSLTAYQSRRVVGEGGADDKGGRQIIKSVRIFVVNGYQPSAPISGHDTSTSALTIVITLLAAGPADRGVRLQHEEPDAIVQTVLHSLDERSALYLPESSSALAVFRAMQDYLRPPQSQRSTSEQSAIDDETASQQRREFTLRYRYADGHAPEIYPPAGVGGGGCGQVVSTFARRYLAKHVSHALLNWVFECVHAACNPQEKEQQTMAGAEEEGEEEADGEQNKSVRIGLSEEGAMLDELSASDILQEMLDALIIEIPVTQPRYGDKEEALLSQPPRILAVRRHESGSAELTLLRTAVALERFRNIIASSAPPLILNSSSMYPSSSSVPSSLPPLLQQLNDLVLVVKIASQCTIAEERINYATGCREPCVVDWSSLLDAVASGMRARLLIAQSTYNETNTNEERTTRLVAADAANKNKNKRPQPAVMARVREKVSEGDAPPPHIRASEGVPRLIKSVGDSYAHRILTAMDALHNEAVVLNSDASDPSDPNVAALGTLYEVGFLRCIAGNTLSFKPASAAAGLGGAAMSSISSAPPSAPQTGAATSAGGTNANASSLSPSPSSTYVSKGLLVETAHVTLVDTEDTSSAPREVGAAPNPSSLFALPLVSLQFPHSPSLGEWLRSYFAEHGTDTVAPQFDSRGFAFDEEQMLMQENQILMEKAKEAYMNQQEKVAIARSTENSALHMRDISRIVRDRQKQLLVASSLGGETCIDDEDDLLASDATITSGVHALDRCFAAKYKGRSSVLLGSSASYSQYSVARLIDKQDMVRIISVALLRLRLLFGHALTISNARYGENARQLSSGNEAEGTMRVGGAASDTVCLGISDAVRVLKDFCDFSQNEERVSHGALLAFCRRRAFEERLTMDDAQLSFDDVALVALEHLLPEETRLSSLSRRDILVIGLESAGKTTIINHIRHQSGRETLATIGIAETFVAHNEWVFAFKELGGRVDFRKNWREYFKTLGKASIHGVVVVVNAQDTKRFGELKDFAKEVVTDRVCSGVPVLFVVNNYEDADGLSSGASVVAASPMSVTSETYTDRRHAQQQHSQRYPPTSSKGRSNGHIHHLGGSSQQTQQQVLRYGGGGKRYTTEQLRKRLELADTANGHHYFAVFCNVTHMSSDKTIDQRLGEGLEWFCGELLNNTHPKARPQKPKT